ncbi:type IV toxin-antitoxin system AbiEi family antitoxin domain-containing protein [Nocardioides panacisoli]|uniref:type IV toxin-antitoxin system AbiEi family antitoxin domain-containing protein n=1 Tax=Nocardioides panacisoli TaxID=627624 RepID=UPI001C62EF83|nr:type IV toxin-antitoxin system AbiEi family antitoxin domain-containing protein [Nocardioides panacisoli]QYJ03440.1 type IV toxin-antitoxin system AbiEi family antitoxin domain-containing protein [Nocardioides panacisoli]
MVAGFDLTAGAGRLLRRQRGVVSRGQLFDLGAAPTDVRRLLRRGQIHRRWPGVYVDHNGPLTSGQREWVAVLAAWPAALTNVSALPEPPPSSVHVAIAHSRKVVVPDWVRVHRTVDLAARTLPGSNPPMIAPEQALLDVMAERVSGGDVPGAFAALARTTYAGRTGGERVLVALDARPRLPGRATVRGLVIDHRDGACSVLERGYLLRVERAHGLPPPLRQHRSFATGRRTDTDVEHPGYGVIIELDGRAHHDSPAARDNDARRDIAELATRGAVTARVTYGLVFGDTCRTAAWVAAILRRRGWRGAFRRCPQCPPGLDVPLGVSSTVTG